MIRFLVLTFCILAGCSVHSTQGAVGPSNPTAAGDAMVIVSPDGPDDAKIPACVADRIQHARPDLTLIPPQTFRNALFPYFERSTAPDDAEGFSRLLARPEVKTRIADLHLRYIAAISGATEMGEKQGSIECVAFYGIAGCSGLVWVKRESKIAAAIWDTRLLAMSTFGSEAHTVWAFGMVGFPLPPLVGASQTPACEAITSLIVAYLAGTVPPAR